MSPHKLALIHFTQTSASDAAIDADTGVDMPKKSKHITARKESATRTADDTGLPHAKPTLRHDSWQKRSTTMSLSMAKVFCVDAQLSILDLESLGLLVRIHALCQTGRTVPTEPMAAARLLGTTARKLAPAIRALLAAAPDLLLIEHGAYKAPTLGLEALSVDSRKENRHRKAALARWSAQAKSSPKHAAESNLASPELPEESAPQALPDLDRAVTCPYQALADAFNATCTALSKVNPTPTWNKYRKSMLSNRWKERPDVAFWSDVFSTVQRSDYLTGRSTAWQCSFDWIIKPANLQKILEGNFTNRGATRRALWDQGDKARDAHALSTMVSVVDVDAPFMRGMAGKEPAIQAGSSGLAHPQAQTPPLAAPSQPAQAVLTPRVGASLAGPAPQGFGARVASRPAAIQLGPSWVRGEAQKKTSRHTEKNYLSIAPGGEAPARFTPDQLRASLVLAKPIRDSASLTADAAHPTPAAIPSGLSASMGHRAEGGNSPADGAMRENFAEVSEIKPAEQRIVRFRSSEKKGN